MSTNEAETRARMMGWLPKDQFVANGRSEDRWVDAETYLKRGEEFIPLLQANNKKLAERVTAAEQRAAAVEARLAEATETIEALKDLRTTLNVDKVKGQKAEIIEQLKEAKKSGDVDAETQLTDKLSEVNLALKEAEKPAAVKTSSAPVLSEEARSWMSENPWFGTDQRKTGYAQGLAVEWKAAGKALGTKEFFAHVDTEMAKVFDQNASRRQTSKVDSSNPSDTGDRGGGRTFADLPADAKAAFEKQVKVLVGANKLYKTKADLQQVYVEQYDWS